MSHDPVHTFLMEVHNICVDAQFVIDSLPNAELPAVERSAHQLGAVRQILSVLEDDSITEDVRQESLETVQRLIDPLEQFIANPPSPTRTFLATEATGKAGRPKFKLNVTRARQLHDLGNSYEDIANAMGVTRMTLYRHMGHDGVSTARRAFTEIDDGALDELVAEISLAHPFVGSVIVSGHLESRGVHLPRLRVQDSLRRVDELGVLVRWAGIIKRRKLQYRHFTPQRHHHQREETRTVFPMQGIPSMERMGKPCVQGSPSKHWERGQRRRH